MGKQRRRPHQQSARYATRRLPVEFIKRIDTIIPKAYRKKVLESLCKKRPTTFRANTLKTTIQRMDQTLRESGFTTQKVQLIPGARILLKPSQQKLMHIPLYTDGCIYLQNLSSMIPALALDPKPSEKVLDICAAPGSKTTQIAALMQNIGELVVNDINQIRLYKLETNLKTQGVTNAIVAKFPAETIWKRVPEQFDKTLVDVPCSMEGTFYCGDPKTFSYWSTKKIHYLAKHQKWILRSAVSATKPGGVIVYSTCTLAPEENEGVIDWILKKEPGALKLESIIISDQVAMPGLTEWGRNRYDPSLNKTIRILPSAIMEGFFVAKLRKIKSTVPQG